MKHFSCACTAADGMKRLADAARSSRTCGGYRPYRFYALGSCFMLSYQPRERRYAPVSITAYGRLKARGAQTEAAFMLFRGLLHPVAVVALYGGSMVCLAAFLRHLPWIWWLLAPIPFVVIPVLYTWLGTRCLPCGAESEKAVQNFLEQSLMESD